MEHLLDFENTSDKKLQKMLDEEEVYTKSGQDGLGVAETYFDPSEAPPHKQNVFRRLWRYDKGVGRSDKSIINNEAGWENDAHLYSNKLNFSETQTKEVKELVEEADLSRCAGNYRAEYYILAICSLVANEYGRFVQEEGVFKDLMKSVNMKTNQLKRLRKRLRAELERF